MDHGNRQIIREYADIKTIVVNCNNCHKTIGEFDEFKKTDSRKNWAAQLNKMDWNIEFKVVNGKIACDCGNKLGSMKSANDVLFDRKSMHLKY